MQSMQSTPKMIFVAATLLPFAVQAQTPEGQAQTTLEEIVVTAQKRSEHAVDVPVSLTVVSGDGLDAAGVADMSSLSQLVPGLHVDSSGAFFQPSIRGVGTAIAGAGASANVATYVDGIYKPNALSNDIDFIDVESIQVLKGPQGTLFGRNATGGAILMTTKQPSHDPQLETKVGFGSFNTVKGSVFATTGLTDKLAASIAGGYAQSDGWTTNVVTGKDANPSETYTARLKFLYAPTDDWKLTLAADIERQDDPSLYAVNSYKGYSNATAFFGIPVITSGARRVSLGSDIVHIAEGHGVDLKVEGDLGFATLTSYSSGRWDSGDEATIQSASDFPANGTLPIQPCTTLLTCTYLGTGGYAFLEVADWHYTEETYSQEFDLSHSGEGAIDWVAGLFFFRDETEYKPFNTALFGPFGPGGALSGALPPWPAGSFVGTGDQHTFDFGATSRSIAVFADVTVKLGELASSLDKFYFTVGGRYAEDEAGVYYTAFPSVATGFAATPYSTAESNFYSFTPRAVIRYAATPDSNLYISYSEGTKAGLYNASGYGTQKDPVNPEKLKDIEAGYKIAAPGWQFEASIFHYDYTDLQVASYVGCCAVFQNAPSSELYGGDVHWQQRLLENLRLDLGFAYTHARYTDFKTAAFQTFDPLFGVQQGAAFLKDVSDGVMQRTPEYSGTVALHYDLPLFNGRLDLDGNFSYQAKVSFDFANTQTQAGYGLLNLRAGWTDPSAHWTFSVSGRNVTDKEYLIQVLPNAGGFGQVYGQPASVMAEVHYQY